MKKKFKIIIAIIVMFILIVISIVYMGYKKLEGQFENAMIQQALQMQKNKDDAKQMKVDQLKQEKLDRETKLIKEKADRASEQVAEDAKIAEEKRMAEEKLLEEKAVVEAAAATAKTEVDRLVAEKSAADLQVKLEAEKQQAIKEAALREKERLEEEARIAAEAEAEEIRLEEIRLENERIAAAEEAAKKAELEETYTDYETDKAKAMEMAFSKLTANQVNRLITMAAGGFDSSEIVEAKKMFYNNFTEQEQTWILEMYLQYYGS